MRTPRRPARERPVCPLCAGSDVDFVGETVEAWLWECPGGRAHWEPRTITVEKVAPTSVPHDGVMAEAGLFEDLPRCLKAGEGWVEHGVVERRFAELSPGAYFKLVAEYGHRTLADHGRKSASNLIARALELLEREGEVVQRKGRATGCFRDNSTCGYWALPPGPVDNKMTSWECYAKGRGLQPDDWDIIGSEAA